MYAHLPLIRNLTLTLAHLALTLKYKNLRCVRLTDGALKNISKMAKSQVSRHLICHQSPMATPTPNTVATTNACGYIYADIRASPYGYPYPYTFGYSGSCPSPPACP